MIIEASAVPNSRRFAIIAKNGKLKISLVSPPENNKANIELIKELSKATGRTVRILSGLSSRKKKLEIDMSEAEWQAFIRDLSL